MNARPLISFDWAMKKMLRNKANFEILEGFLSALLGGNLTVRQLLESEGDVASEELKSNRLDMLVETSANELIIVELQYDSEWDYFHRTLFATSKLIVDHLEKGELYEKVRKIYSVNLVYFDLGHGKDYVYHGKTEFRGLHQNDILTLNERQASAFKYDAISQIYPEYYIIKIDNFDNVAKSSLDEWIYYLKNYDLKEEFHAKGIDRVRERLQYESLTKSEQRAYDAYRSNRSRLNNQIDTARLEGIAKGLEEGRSKGRTEGLTEGRTEGRSEGRTEMQREMVRAMKAKGFSLQDISGITGLAGDEIERW